MKILQKLLEVEKKEKNNRLNCGNWWDLFGQTFRYPWYPWTRTDLADL